jgi:hypothetical protein
MHYVSTTTWSTLAVAGASDPTKRVNYTNGMILGVDDFTQEATYVLARDRWLARETLGYGTLTGLRVSLATDEEHGPQVKVNAGVALTPTGYLVEVTQEQCAWLNDWLIANREQVTSPGDGERLSLYIVLRYRECPTDDQPVPGEPCRTADSSTAPSRVTDDFQLEIVTEPPKQLEEDAVRAFAAWLATIPIKELDEDGLLQRFEQAIPVFATASEPSTGPLEFATPDKWGTVPPPDDVVIPSDQVAEYLRVAFRIWGTLIRPLTLGDGRTRSSTPPVVEDILLAEVTVLLQEATDEDGNKVYQVDKPAEAQVNEANRPHLLHLRMVQEWLLRQWREPETLETPPPSIPYGTAVKPETTFGAAASAGTSTDVSRADHTHGSPPDPIPAHRADASAHTLAGDVTGATGSSKVTGLQGRGVDAAAPADGDLLGFNTGSWRPVKPPAGGGTTTLAGDVTGPAGTTRVVRLQNQPLNATPPTNGQVLTFSGGAWQPLAPVTEPATGPFVEHPEKAGPYRVVAAGTVEFSFGDGTLRHVGPNDQLYNQLRSVAMESDGEGADFIVAFTFEGYQRPDLGDPKTRRYVVKALPWFEYEDKPTPAHLFFNVAVRTFGEDIKLCLFGMTDAAEGPRGRISIEVSEYLARPQEQ